MLSLAEFQNACLRMKRLIFCLFLSYALSGLSAGDPQAGQNKSAVCGACHGADGRSSNVMWPNLAGQHATYLLQQLQHYQTGKTRPSPIMVPLVSTLTQQDMEDLAAFYAQKQFAPPAPSSTPTTPRAEQLYRQGDIEQQIPACIACHGPDGRGAEQAGFPVISHQQPEYIIQQLQAFKTSDRSSDPAKIMRTICAKLSPQDMQDLAQYLTKLD